jgi:acyl-CoA synthetase (AMP-forming)/AMP-acid ligase II
MPSILERLEYWVNKNPRKLLYAFLDLQGRETEKYTYEGFLGRVSAIAGGLRAAHRFENQDRLLLAYPPGLEMICAFFGCARAGLIPVPVYLPSVHGFQAALCRMAHVARDCGAAAILTSREYDATLEAHMARNGNSSDSPEAACVSKLKRIITEDMRSRVAERSFGGSEILFLQYTSGSTGSPKGVMVTHGNILHNCSLALDHSSPVGVSWLPQYHDMGLIGYYLYLALSGGATYGFSPVDFIQRPALWFDAIAKYRATASSAPNFAFEYCLRPGRLSKETLENIDLSSLRCLMAAAEPVRPGTYERFLRTFQPMGLAPKYFYVAYGLAENTLAVSSHGRNVLSVGKDGLAARRVRVTKEVSEIAGSKRIVSCGRPLGDIVVRIVDPDKRVALDDGNVGEIWVAGESRCLGYWNNSEMTERTFHARILGEGRREDGYLRTGDLGFLHRGELYVCGRTKDMLIVRGQNYFPQDIEHVVEDASGLVRKSCVVAFEIAEGRASALAVIAEVKGSMPAPDPRVIAAAIRDSLNLEAAVVAFVAPKSIPKTSSGKIMRHLAKQMWLEGKFEAIRQYARCDLDNRSEADTGGSSFQALKTRYKLTGDEPYTLVEAGVDSLDLVCIMHEVKELLKEKGGKLPAREVDIWLIQQMSVADLFRLADLFERSPEAAVFAIGQSLARMQEEHRRREEQMMSGDRKLRFAPGARNGSSRLAAGGGLLLTGGTGFVGPFLLKSLLEQTGEDIYVLIRASTDASGKERLWEAFQSIDGGAAGFRDRFENRVRAVCGDLGQPRLGLSKDRWKSLTSRVHTIYHNGAAVNYLLNYGNMRAPNVAGTNEIVKLAFDCGAAALNYVSTTFIFGLCAGM